MALGVPVADVSADPGFVYETIGYVGDLCLVEDRINPFLTGNDILVVGTYSEAGEEAHQLEGHVIFRCGDEAVIVGVARMERGD